MADLVGLGKRQVVQAMSSSWQITALNRVEFENWGFLPKDLGLCLYRSQSSITYPFLVLCLQTALEVCAGLRFPCSLRFSPTLIFAGHLAQCIHWFVGWVVEVLSRWCLDLSLRSHTLVSDHFNGTSTSLTLAKSVHTCRK